ncbi:MAG: hypothetical protein RBR77_04075 [Thauera sp.]|jgi:hypothetical protein|nr:hypothetical protein [Thauera sp.]
MSERKSNNGGRPTAYREEFNEQAYKLCLLGATDAEMADFFGVSEQTLNAWKKAHGGFLESITRGKLLADATVAEKLYQRAIGYEHEAVKIMQYQGEELLVPYTERYPPDTQAASLWLRNRQPSKWRDKQELEHTGKDGAPLIPAIDASKLSDAAIAELLAARNGSEAD